MQRYHSADDLEHAVRHLAGLDRRFDAVLKQHGTPSLRVAEAGLAGLLLIVTEQFLSLQAASAIWSRITAALNPDSAEELLGRSHADLLALGLSNAKAKSFHGIARAVTAGQLDFAALGSLDDEAVRKTLLVLPGVGPWTVEIYLLSNLQRCDAWPSGDLALQMAVQDIHSLPERPTVKYMNELAAGWRPHRAAAARLLWSHYRGLKGLAQAT